MDIGCGDGFVTNRINARRVVGIDPYRGLVKDVASHKVVGAGEKLPLRRGSVDVVVMSEVLEHLPDAALRSVAREVDHLAPATLVVSVPEREDIAFAVTSCENGHTFHPSRHVQSLSEEDVSALFPAYRVTDVQRMTKAFRNARWVRSLARVMRIRFHWTGARCPECGGASAPSSKTRMTFFRLFSATDRILQELIGRRHTYHIVLRLERQGSQRAASDVATSRG